jgi:hypothetical protein
MTQLRIVALFGICLDHAATRDNGTILVFIWDHVTARDNGTTLAFLWDHATAQDNGSILVYILQLWVMALVWYLYEGMVKVRIMVLYWHSYCFAA